MLASIKIMTKGQVWVAEKRALCLQGKVGLILEPKDNCPDFDAGKYWNRILKRSSTTSISLPNHHPKSSSVTMLQTHELELALSDKKNTNKHPCETSDSQNDAEYFSLLRHNTAYTAIRHQCFG
jgi:hypothetical protein